MDNQTGNKNTLVNVEMFFCYEETKKIKKKGIK